MSNSTVDRPEYGRRILCNLIDEIAAENGDKIYGSFPITENPADGFRDLSYSQLANAINRCAWFLQEHLGHESDYATFAYIGGLGDFRYQLLCIAAMKAKKKVESAPLTP